MMNQHSKPPLINTVALARCRFRQLASLAVSTAWGWSGKPLKRFTVHSSDPHRAKAAVSMGAASGILGVQGPALVAGFVLLVAAAVSAAEPEPGYKSIFNGKDLTGWDGNPKLWSVKEGVIIGQTTAENPLKGNTFLIWTNGEVGDFDLRCSSGSPPTTTRDLPIPVSNIEARFWIPRTGLSAVTRRIWKPERITQVFCTRSG